MMPAKRGLRGWVYVLLHSVSLRPPVVCPLPSGSEQRRAGRFLSLAQCSNTSQDRRQRVRLGLSRKLFEPGESVSRYLDVVCMRLRAIAPR